MEHRYKKLCLGLGFSFGLTMVSAPHWAAAHDHAHHGGIQTEASNKIKPDFDIFHTKITTEGNVAIFHIAVSGKAGKTRPAKSGKLRAALFSLMCGRPPWTHP